MNINSDVAYSELCAENKYLRGRNLALAQTLHEVTGERDQLLAELKALKEELEGYRNGNPE